MQNHMGKASSKSLVAFGIVATAIVIGAMFYAGIGPISLLYLIFLASIIWHCLIRGIYGLYKSRSEVIDDAHQKEREAAMVLAWAPGLGHIYLGEFKRSFIPLTALVISVICISYDLLIGTEMYLFIYGLILYFYAAFWSCIDVNEICNQLGLVHSDSPFEMNWTRNSLSMDILSITTYVLTVLITYAFMKYLDQDQNIGIAIILLATIFLLELLLRHKYAQDKTSDYQ